MQFDLQYLFTMQQKGNVGLIHFCVEEKNALRCIFNDHSVVVGSLLRLLCTTEARGMQN